MPWSFADMHVVRDITDISHAKTVSTFMTSPPQFVSGTELAYADESGLFRMPLSGSPKTLVSKSGQAVSLFSWSPSGSTVAYVSQSQLWTWHFHLRVSGGRIESSRFYAVPASGRVRISVLRRRLGLSALLLAGRRFHLTSGVDCRGKCAFRLWSLGRKTT